MYYKYLLLAPKRVQQNIPNKKPGSHINHAFLIIHLTFAAIFYTLDGDLPWIMGPSAWWGYRHLRHIFIYSQSAQEKTCPDGKRLKKQEQVLRLHVWTYSFGAINACGIKPHAIIVILFRQKQKVIWPEFLDLQSLTIYVCTEVHR